MLNGEDEEDRLPLTKNEWEDDGRREEGDEVIKEGRQHQTNGSLSVLISIADSVFSLFVVFPLVCLYWRGTFGLQDVYLAPGDIEMSCWLSFGIGANLCLMAYLVQPALDTLMESQKTGPHHTCHLGGLNYFLLTRLYLYVHSWAVLCYWRGVWEFLDLYLGHGWVNSLVLYGVCQCVTMCTLTVRSVTGPPLALQRDTDPDLLRPLTVFRVDSEETIRYAADALFSLFIVLTSVIVIWRGVWNVFDHVIFPGDPVMSDVVSFGAGMALMTLMLLLQPLCSRISAALDLRPVAKVVFEDVVMVAATWSNILLWRGGWNLCLRYVIPDPEIGSWFSHVTSTFLLIGLQLFSVVAFNGIDRDGSYTDGAGIFPTKYFHVYLEHWVIQPMGGQHHKVKVKVVDDAETGSCQSLVDEDADGEESQSENSSLILYDDDVIKTALLNSNYTSVIVPGQGQEQVVTQPPPVTFQGQVQDHPASPAVVPASSGNVTLLQLATDTGYKPTVVISR